ncbi:MAG: hypothetical protein AUK27_05205 [Deltaproteobacteria bacterium CG2_30_66_27]|nr:MAG: hypothetical protein AUK27_05205 [Deltaproteobacteria bacterium CG2_30_66_27]
MKHTTIKTGILVASMLGVGGMAFAENPLFMPKAETGPQLMSTAETDGLKKEAEGLKRKAELLKAAAGKKYAASSELRKKAGGFRSESSRKGEMLRSKAEASAEVSSMIGDLFGLMSGMGGAGNLSQNAMLTSALTGKMIQGQQASAAKDVAAAHGQTGQLSMEAEKKAGPLEMRADELENEGNRLMEAHNRLMGIANAKFLLVASEELLRKVDADGRRMARLKEDSREFVASMPGR